MAEWITEIIQMPLIEGKNYVEISEAFMNAVDVDSVSIQSFYAERNHGEHDCSVSIFRPHHDFPKRMAVGVFWRTWEYHGSCYGNRQDWIDTFIPGYSESRRGPCGGAGGQPGPDSFVTVTLIGKSL